jgi:hypothetical protein
MGRLTGNSPCDLWIGHSAPRSREGPDAQMAPFIPDEWFPVSIDAEAARREAAGAISICTACPVRAACLELALRHWTIGQHGVWGGLVPAERATLRRHRLASATEYDFALFMAGARTASRVAVELTAKAQGGS